MSNSNRDDETNSTSASPSFDQSEETNEQAGDVPADSPASMSEKLASTIVSDIIPRLLLAHRVGASQSGIASAGLAVGASDVAAFVDILLSSDSQNAASFVDGLLLRGVPLEAILLDLMSPAARRLGDLWTTDECDFVDVTLGVSRMHSLLRRLSGDIGVNDNRVVRGRRALLLPAPGEQHTFGLRIVEEFLLRDGWTVRAKLNASLDEATAIVGSEDFDFVGFTLSGEVFVSALREAISVTRKTSKNRSIRVIVGGVAFAEQPALVESVGADALALKAEEAVNQARQWALLN